MNTTTITNKLKDLCCNRTADVLDLDHVAKFELKRFGLVTVCYDFWNHKRFLSTCFSFISIGAASHVVVKWGQLRFGVMVMIRPWQMLVQIDVINVYYETEEYNYLTDNSQQTL